MKELLKQNYGFAFEEKLIDEIEKVEGVKSVKSNLRIVK